MVRPPQPRPLKPPLREEREEGRAPKLPKNATAPGTMQGWSGWGGRNRVPIVVSGKLTQLARGVQVNGEVQVTITLGTGPHANGAKDLLTSLHCQVVFHIEHYLLAAYIWGLGAGEAQPLAAARELDVDVSHRAFHFTCRQKGEVKVRSSILTV